jgi:ketosteroid isomerase-like protein
MDRLDPTDRAEAAVRSILADIAQAHAARDAAAIGRHYAADAVIADLAPPLLRRGFDAAAMQAWLDGWVGPVELVRRDIEIVVAGDLALCQGLQHTAAPTQGGERAAWWARYTLAFARTAAGWRIVHHHESVPFHMDGSYRAAIDLEP